MAPMTQEDGLNKLRGYLLQIECPPEVLEDVLSRADCASIEELGLDSRDMLMLVFFIEEDFDISVDIEHIVGATTVSDIVNYILGCASGRL